LQEAPAASTAPTGPGLAERVLQWTANAALALMMLFTVVDVIGRYLINQPVRGGLELTEFLMVILIFAALPVVTGRDEHVTFDLADRFFPGRAGRWQRVAGQAIAVALSLGLAWVMIARGLRMQPIGDATQILKVPLYPFAYLMGGLLVVNAVAHLVRIMAELRARRG
jgi:TRAP-type C4-dicarboxylate transport system permease small subunit